MSKSWRLQWFGEKAKALIFQEIDRQMRLAGQAWKDMARSLAPVRSGHLRSTIGFAYDASTRKLRLFCDAPYAYFQEFGTRLMKGTAFMRPAISAIPRIWRGKSTLQAPNVAEKYHERIKRHAKGKTRGVKLDVGRGDYN